MEESSQNTPISLFVEELYVARCKDTQEVPSREEFVRFSARMKDKVTGSFVNLRNQHIGALASTAISKSLRTRQNLKKVDLSMNVIKDHGFQTISHFVTLNRNVETFFISNNDLTDKSAIHFNTLILSNHLRSLNIGLMDSAVHQNNFTSITVEVIADALLKSDSLQALGLDGTKLDVKATSTAPTPELALVKLLQGNKTLLHLSLSNCKLQNDCFMNVIENGFCFNNSLRRLNISHNQLSAAIGERFADYMTQHTKEVVERDGAEDPEKDFDIVETDNYPNIFYLDASYNMFNSQTATAFASVLSRCDRLGFLDLSFNEIGDEGAKEFASALATNETLVELHIAGNGITSVGGIAIAKSLKTNKTLTTLNISKNKLGDETANAFSDAMKYNESLITLNFSTAMFSDKGGIKIAEATTQCPSLLNLDMSDNFFTEESGPALEKVFRENGTILKINVSGTQINHFSFRALNEICERNLRLLKQEQQKPLRNQYIRSQFSIVELGRKENILKELLDEKSQLQEEIDQLKETIQTLKEEEDLKSKDLSKQIQEKEQQMKTEAESFATKKEQFDEALKELNTKKEELQKAIEEQSKQNAELRAKVENRKGFLKKISDDFEENKAAKEEEVKKIMKAADELMRIAKDPEAIAALDKLPEFLVFEDENKKEEAPPPVTIPDQTPSQASEKGKKSSKKRSKSPKK